MNLRAQLLQRPDIVLGAREADDLVPMSNEFFCGFGADESRGAGNEYAHVNAPCSDRRDIGMFVIRVK
jgi:hypothetical protein